MTSLRTLLYSMVAALLVPALFMFGYYSLQVGSVAERAGFQKLQADTQRKALHAQRKLIDASNKALERQSALLHARARDDAHMAIIDELRLGFSMLERSAFAASLSRRVNQYQTYQSRKEQFEASLLRVAGANPELAAAIQPRFQHLVARMDAVDAGLSKRNKRPAIKIFLEQVVPESQAIYTELDNAAAGLAERDRHNRKAIAELVSDLKDGATRIAASGHAVDGAASSVERTAAGIAGDVGALSTLSWLMLAVFAAAAPVAGWLMARSISRPLEKAERTITRIAARRDLSIDLPRVGGDVGKLLDATRSLLHDVSSVFHRARTANSGFESASRQLVDSANRSADRLREQQRDSALLYQAITELEALSREVATLSLAMDDSAVSAQQLANDGYESVVRSVNSVDDMVGSIGEVKRGAEAVVEGIENVSRFLDAIETIANQTNMLAINAAIEAASAGDSGTGFSVVAHEVGGLSRRTRSASDEIRGNIRSLRLALDRMHGAMLESEQRAVDATATAASVKDALQRITGASTDIAQRIQRAVSIAEHQSTLTTTAAQRLGQIKDHIDSTAEVTNDVAAIASRTCDTALELTREMDRFICAAAPRPLADAD